MGKIQRESKGKQQPANGCKNSPRQLLPGVLFFCGNNGVEQYKGKQKQSDGQQAAETDYMTGEGFQQGKKPQKQVLDCTAKYKKH